MFGCLSVLQLLREHADDSGFQEDWMSVKAQAKKKAAARIESLTGIKVNPNALFDVQVRTGPCCGQHSYASGCSCILAFVSPGRVCAVLQCVCSLPCGLAARSQCLTGVLYHGCLLCWCACACR